MQGAAVPWSHFALAYPGMLGAALAVGVHVVARVRGSRGAGSTAAAGRAGLVTAVFAGLVMLAGAPARSSDHHQAAMARAHSGQNVLVACTSG